MTSTATAALTIFASLNEVEHDDLHGLVFGDGTTVTANAYVRDIGAIEGHSPWTWACGADLAQYRYAGLNGSPDTFFTYGFETVIGWDAVRASSDSDTDGHHAVFV